MATLPLVVLGGAAGVVTADTAATANTIAYRDGTGALASPTPGLQAWVTSAKTTAFTADTAATVYLCSAAAGYAATLPAAATATGRIYVFKKTDNNANAVTITGSGAETIDGLNTKALSAQYKYAVIVCDGTSWWIVSSN